ncbi:hypothetical protein B4O97_17075 [Marispirochaeta aestuarii]|uniref:Type II secretion system protein K n=1 Tax=Marispirochaeta aestuarii TaxID=1963862 RepID=A0A1Y1RTZ1_9SPIO|nr:hypothetical protein [Marispirochaeta aestuarii]ORC31225.1 hypothetical protein B4O97_17075 [Marispirochaeta aestuarii]
MRSRQHADEGSITAVALVLLIISTGLTLSAASMAWTQRRQLASFRDSTKKSAEMIKIADSVQEFLEELDPSEPDWSGSAVFTDIALLESEESCTVTLEDISSRFSINSMNTKMISETEVRSFLLPGMGADAFQQDREDDGFAVDILARFGNVFKEEFLANYATSRGYWNINTADEFSLKKVFAEITGNEAAAEEFHHKLRERRRTVTLVKPEELEEFVGVHWFDRVFPCINAFPSVNIHFTPDWVLKQIISYPAFRVTAPEAVAREISSLRGSRAILQEELPDMIPVQEKDEGGNIILPKEQNRLFAYMGTVTWFWQISVEKDASRLIRVVARIPDKRGPEGELHREYRTVYEVLPW